MDSISAARFTPLKEEETDLAEDSQEFESLSSDDYTHREPVTFPGSYPKFSYSVIFGCLLVSGIVTGFFIGLWTKGQQPQLDNIDEICLERQSYFSPALKDLNPVLNTVRFNGTLDHPSQYRGSPSPQIDAAWDILENVRVMSVSGEELRKSGFTMDSVRLPEEFGGGFMASIEVNHQLHCLNFLRKALHRQYYQFRAAEFTDSDAMIETHLDHCVEMLRQTLMCHADVGLISHRWVKNYMNPYPDFNVMHQCRDFEQTLQWTYDHQIPEPPARYPWRPQPGEKIWDSPP